MGEMEMIEQFLRIIIVVWLLLGVQRMQQSSKSRRSMCVCVCYNFKISNEMIILWVKEEREQKANVRWS